MQSSSTNTFAQSSFTNFLHLQLLALTPDCGHALSWDKLKEPTEDTSLMFAKYVTGFYKNSAEYLANKSGKQVLILYRSGALEPNFREYFAKIAEPDYTPAILHWFLADTEAGRSEACHEAFREMKLEHGGHSLGR